MGGILASSSRTPTPEEEYARRDALERSHPCSAGPADSRRAQPTGEYEDFMTGFVLDNNTVWGRPTGLTVTGDGALLVSDDANGTIFRVTRK